MKASARELAARLAKPAPELALILLYGADAMRVSLKRREVVALLTGKGAEDEMRITRLTAADLRKEPARLTDSVKAVGFFPGPRAVVVEEAGDGTWPALEATLASWAPGDAQMVVTAGALAARSRLRKGVEAAGAALATGIYDDPPARGEVMSQAAKAGLQGLARDAEDALYHLALGLDPGEFAQTLEKIALYAHDRPEPPTPETIADLAPGTQDVGVAAAIDRLAERDVKGLTLTLRRLAVQGLAPSTLSLAAARHFRQLHRVLSAPQGPEKGVASLRPPVFGPRRDAILRQARLWPAGQVEAALALLLQTEHELRGGRDAPPMALLERALIRIALLR